MNFQTISREEAARQNLTHFFTGKPCRYGHTAQRFVSTGSCTACNLARAARFRKDAPRPFSYDLHPDDVAAALAYCQALDIQRGRMPTGLNQARLGSAQPANAPFVLPEPIAKKLAFGYPDGKMPQMTLKED